MDISFLGDSSFKIKSKLGKVTVSPSKVMVGELTVTEPGEYEVDGISVFGYSTEPGNAIYVIQAEGTRVLYLGTQKTELADSILEELNSIDVLMVPTDPSKEAIKNVEAVEPTYVLPMGGDVQKFVKDYEHGSRTVSTLTINKSTLPEDLTEVIIFQ